MDKDFEAWAEVQRLCNEETPEYQDNTADEIFAAIIETKKLMLRL